MVTTYDILIECEQNGSLEKLRAKGIISFKPIIHKEIYERLILEIRENQHLSSPINQAVHNTSVFFDMSESSIWKLKKSMES